MHTCIHENSCMPNTDVQADTYVCQQTYIHTSHAFQPRNIYYFRVRYLHNFQICIFPEFPYLWKYGKSDRYGNKKWANMVISIFH